MAKTVSKPQNPSPSPKPIEQTRGMSNDSGSRPKK